MVSLVIKLFCEIIPIDIFNFRLCVNLDKEPEEDWNCANCQEKKKEEEQKLEINLIV